MRGFPLFQVLIVAVLFAAAGLAVWKLTRPAADIATPASTPANVPEPVNAATFLAIDASFAPAPTDFQVRCQDQTVLEGHGPGRQFSTRWKASVPKEGIDLVIRATWPHDAAAAASGPAAARLIVGTPNGAKIDNTFWTEPGKSLAEIVTVPGSTP